MKISHPSVAKFLATMTLLVLITPLQADAGVFRWLFGGRSRSRSTCYRYQPQCQPQQQQAVIVPTQKAPIPQTPTVKPDGHPSGPPAPPISPSVKASRIERTPPVVAKQPVFNIHERIAKALRKDNVVRNEIQHTILHGSSPKQPSFALTSKPVNFDLASQGFDLVSTPNKFNLLGLSRPPAVKAYEEETPKNFSLVNRSSAVKSMQEASPKVPKPPIAPGSFVLANQGPPPEPKNPKYTPPALEIGGADSAIALGELVQLWIKEPDQLPENLVSTAYTWTVLPQKNYVVWPDRTRILFGAGVKDTTYVVIITASHVFGEKDVDGKVSKLHQEAVSKMVSVKIGAGGGTGGNGGTGTGGNGGTGGPTLTGIAKQSYDWVMGVAVNDTYPVANRKADAAKLAASFQSIAVRISKGELTDVSAILKATKDSNDNAITSRDQWLPWFTKMSEFLQQAYNAGTLKTTQQFQTAWEDIAKGLNAASK